MSVSSKYYPTTHEEKAEFAKALDHFYEFCDAKENGMSRKGLEKAVLSFLNQEAPAVVMERLSKKYKKDYFAVSKASGVPKTTIYRLAKKETVDYRKVNSVCRYDLSRIVAAYHSADLSDEDDEPYLNVVTGEYDTEEVNALCYSASPWDRIADFERTYKFSSVDIHDFDTLIRSMLAKKEG